jgi:UDP-N-acetylmuramoyl-tripeptide--D-alanyl-D-alanine ligase
VPVASTSRVTIVGAAGRTSTSRMIAEIAAGSTSTEWPPTVVLLSRGDELSAAGEPRRSWSEVLSSVAPGTTIVTPSGDRRLTDAARLTGAAVITAGFDSHADVRVTKLVARSSGTELELTIGGAPYSARLSVLGEHLAEDAVSAIAASVAAGVDAARAISALEGLEALGDGIMSPRRAASGVLVIDDTRSMSPESVVAALKALAMFGTETNGSETTAGTEGRRTVAILGALDLGGSHDLSPAAIERHREAHDRIGRIVVRLNIAQLVVVGHDARHIHNAAGLEGSWNGESVLVESLDEAYHRVRDELGEGDVVLVKLTAAHAAELVRRLENGSIR